MGLEEPCEERARRQAPLRGLHAAAGHGLTCPNTDRLPCTSQTSQSEGGAREGGTRRLGRRVGGSSIKNHQTAGPQACLNIGLFKGDFCKTLAS